MHICIYILLKYECIEFRDCVVQNGSVAQQKDESTIERNFAPNRIHSINAFQMHRRKSRNRWNKQINLNFRNFLCVNYLVLSLSELIRSLILYFFLWSLFFACGGVWTSASALHSRNDDLFCVYIGRSVGRLYVRRCLCAARRVFCCSFSFAVAAAAAAVATSTASFTSPECVCVCECERIHTQIVRLTCINLCVAHSASSLYVNVWMCKIRSDEIHSWRF